MASGSKAGCFDGYSEGRAAPEDWVAAVQQLGFAAEELRRAIEADLRAHEAVVQDMAGYGRLTEVRFGGKCFIKYNASRSSMQGFESLHQSLLLESTVKYG